MPALGYKSMTGFEGSNKIPQCANYVYSEAFKSMLENLSANIICSEKRTVFRDPTDNKEN